MKEIFRKRLTEACFEHRQLHVPHKVIPLLPKKMFKITIGGVEVIKKIDKYGRISLNVRNLAKAGDIIVFLQKPDGSYSVSFESSG